MISERKNGSKKGKIKMNHFKEGNYITDRDHNSLILQLVRIYTVKTFKLYYVLTLSENYPNLFSSITCSIFVV